MVPRVWMILVIAVGLVACGDDGTSANVNNGNNNNGTQPPECGNGEVEALEECDDGDDNSDTEPDACRTDCTEPICGDLVVDTNEGCDDGEDNSDDTPDACRTDCSEPECGDGVTDPAFSEECDDGNTDGDDGCGPTCLHEVCGDGIQQVDEECDDGAQNSDIEPDACRQTCVPAFCGDGVADSGEVCDDGNSSFGDGCSPDCLSDETCGNGIVDSATSEACDDGNLLSHDGCSSGCTLEDLVWENLAPATSPSVRLGHRMTWDASRNRVVLFGGWDGAVALADTWEFDGVTWIETTPAGASPPARFVHGQAFCGVCGGTVVFGGKADVTTTRGDTWVYDGTGWTEPTITTSPAPLSSFTMAGDPLGGYVVFVTGSMIGGPETWEFDGTQWQIATPSGPGSIGWYAMTYDASNMQALLYGGSFMASPSTMLWSYAATQWAYLTPTVSPPARSEPGLAYDAVRSRAVMFGGDDGSSSFDPLLADTWEWDGVAWIETSPIVSPSARSRFGFVYSPLSAGTILFGGYTDSPTCDDETWIYRYTSAWPEEICDNGTDDDQDGAVDCGDPDCDGMPCNGGVCAGSVCQ